MSMLARLFWAALIVWVILANHLIVPMPVIILASIVFAFQALMAWADGLAKSRMRWEARMRNEKNKQSEAGYEGC